MIKRRISGREHPKENAKRRKLDQEPAVDAAVSDITSPTDLKALIVFDQGAGSQLRQNIAHFEVFVKSLQDDQAASSTSRDVLLQFLQPESSSKSDEASTPLAPILQTWSYATKTEHDALLRTIPSTLATLLATISKWLAFRNPGLAVARAILQQDAMSCIEQCIKPNRHRPGVIIGCLRLLTEVVAFDGGTLAARVVRQKEVFRLLETLLTMPGRREEEVPEKKRKYHVSIREAAVRFLLANLRYQNAGAKSELVAQGTLIRNLMRGVENDSPELVKELLIVAQRDVLEDLELGAGVKSRFLMDTTLLQVAKLYRYTGDGPGENENGEIANMAHEVLLSACVPREASTETRKYRGPSAELDLETEGFTLDLDAQGRKSDAGTTLVKSHSLLVLLSRLRPHANPLQKSLVLAIFEARPHLISDYFRETSFQFDAKLTATWIGYASFLLSVVMLPLPHKLAIRAASKTGESAKNSAVRHSILPAPLQREVLERCLNLVAEPLMIFFAARILVAAFQKLEKYLELLKTNATDFKAASKSILDWICLMCPRGSVVATAYKKVDEKSPLLKEQMSRLLLYYYSLAPKLVADAKFDASTSVAQALEASQAYESLEVREELSHMQLTNLLRIASLSPAMRWWSPSGKSLSYSPFTSVLRVYVSRESERPEILDLMRSILRNHSILQPRRLNEALTALVRSLELEKTDPLAHVTFAFLDSCLFQLSRHDLKYTSMLYGLVDGLDLRRDKELDSFSLLLITVAEQWSFAVAARETEQLAHLASWVARYFDAMDDIGESRTILRSLREEMVAGTPEIDARATIEQALPQEKKLPILRRASDAGRNQAPTTGLTNGTPSTSLSATKAALRASLDVSLATVSSPQNHPALTRWRRKDPSDSLDDGTVADLITYLSSPHAAIRKQAQSALASYTTLLTASDIESKQQLYLLFSELLETATFDPYGPLPSLATALARTAISILQTPLHFLFAKLNEFLLQRPSWVVARLPSYWLRAIFQAPPAQMGCQPREMAWLLDLLTLGLQNPDDVDLYRGNGVVERVLARCAPGMVLDEIADKAARLVFRYAQWEPGATSLVTRYGILAWLEAGLARCAARAQSAKDMGEQGAAGNAMAADVSKAAGEDIAATDAPHGVSEKRKLMLLCILDRVVEMADVERVRVWSAGGFERMVASMRRRYEEGRMGWEG